MDDYERTIPFTVGDTVTLEAWMWLAAFVDAFNALEARVTALEP